MKRHFSLAALLCLASATAGSACDLCAIHSAIDATSSGTGFFGGLMEQWTHYGTLLDNGHQQANAEDQRMDSVISQAFVGYQFTPRTGIQLNAPYIYRSFRRAEGFAFDQGREYGWGDVSLAGTHQVYRHFGVHSTVVWSAIAGIKFPTGDSSRLREELSEFSVPGAPESGIHGHDLALGSGSFDGVVGTSLFLRRDRWNVASQVQYAIRTRGDYGFRHANDLSWSAVPSYFLLLEDDYTLALGLNISGEYKGEDHVSGVRSSDTALTSVYLGPELALTWSEHFSARLGFDLPAYLDNSGIQSVPDYRLRATLAWRF